MVKGLQDSLAATRRDKYLSSKKRRNLVRREARERFNEFKAMNKVTHQPTFESRKCKLPHQMHIHKALQPGQILILLSGRFRGRRVVYLKTLKSGLLLVTGPYKYNGVPLKRVNQAYCIPTSTSVKLDAKIADGIEDDLFKRIKIERKSEKDFFEDDATKKKRIDPKRIEAQTSVDSKVKNAVDAVPMLKEYLKCRFSLKSGDKPHLMKF